MDDILRLRPGARALITRTAMYGERSGCGLAYSVEVPIEDIEGEPGYRIIRGGIKNSAEFVPFAMATASEAHQRMPRGFDRWDDWLAHEKRANALALELAKMAYPELAEVDRLPTVSAFGLVPEGTETDAAEYVEIPQDRLQQ